MRKEVDLPGQHYTMLNNKRTEVGRYSSRMKKRGQADSEACQCNESEQTAEHIIKGCPLLFIPPPDAGLFELRSDTRACLNTPN